MRKYLWNVTRIGAATADCQNQKLGTNLEGAKSLEPGEPPNSVGQGVCLLSSRKFNPSHCSARAYEFRAIIGIVTCALPLFRHAWRVPFCTTTSPRFRSTVLASSSPSQISPSETTA